MQSWEFAFTQIGNNTSNLTLCLYSKLYLCLCLYLKLYLLRSAVREVYAAEGIMCQMFG